MRGGRDQSHAFAPHHEVQPQANGAADEKRQGIAVQTKTFPFPHAQHQWHGQQQVGAMHGDHHPQRIAHMQMGAQDGGHGQVVALQQDGRGQKLQIGCNQRQNLLGGVQHVQNQVVAQQQKSRY